jgi:dTDP-4-dehydrorhamnose reductase
MKILVLGVSGMLGNVVFRYFSEDKQFEVFGSARRAGIKNTFPVPMADRILMCSDVDNPDSLAQLFAAAKPDVVINCVGLVKQNADASDPLLAIPLNSLLPHRLARLCEIANARLIHISTDCIFAGDKGNYLESDLSDASDLYGRSKYLGEVNYKHAITLRTSTIGHELYSSHGLINWFLVQQGRITGYKKAIFSGLPTIELAHIIRDIVVHRPEFSGLYHVAAAPISKYDLLKLVAEVYNKPIDIDADENFVIDRSLNAAKFAQDFGYVAPDWPKLIRKMFASQLA